ncbi:MAG: hypothetical protein LC107_13425 [Chitinophagales bacterium]|nr:hypothetical protein [Chitinophagales bacterium]
MERVRIIDCHNDDLPCHEYYNGSSKPGIQDTDITLAETDHQEVNDFATNNSLRLIIYNLMGNIVEQTNIQKSIVHNPKILIYTYWDKDGRLVSSKKVIVSE